MRRYIRHPASIPIEVAAGAELAEHAFRTYNVGEFGIAFRADRALAPGTVITLRIFITTPPFETAARVVWCQAGPDGYEVGVEFADPDQAFRARMFEQVCHIEHYRKEVLQMQGRQLTSDQAAAEWISRFASRFPRAN